jgi:hypothetical protein
MGFTGFPSSQGGWILMAGRDWSGFLRWLSPPDDPAYKDEDTKENPYEPHPPA